VTDAGASRCIACEDRWFFEVPDSLAMRDFLFVTRCRRRAGELRRLHVGRHVARGAAGAFERDQDRVVLRSLEVGAYADDSLPIARSVAENNYGPILAASRSRRSVATATRTSSTSRTSSPATRQGISG
jgi:hypothetical protein